MGSETGTGCSPVDASTGSSADMDMVGRASASRWLSYKTWSSEFSVKWRPFTIMSRWRLRADVSRTYCMWNYVHICSTERAEPDLWSKSLNAVEGLYCVFHRKPIIRAGGQWKTRWLLNNTKNISQNELCQEQNNHNILLIIGLSP